LLRLVLDAVRNRMALALLLTERKSKSMQIFLECCI
jgi:hypothetical protein